MARLAVPYVPRRPHETVLYALVKEHLHLLCLDGVYVDDGETLRFEPAPPPIRAELRTLVERICGRVIKWLGRRGLLRRADDADASNETPELSATEALATAGMQRGKLLAVREGEDGTVMDDGALIPPPPPRQTDAVIYERFNIHASVHLAADDELSREPLQVSDASGDLARSVPRAW